MDIGNIIGISVGILTIISVLVTTIAYIMNLKSLIAKVEFQTNILKDLIMEVHSEVKDFHARLCVLESKKRNY